MFPKITFLKNLSWLTVQEFLFQMVGALFYILLARFLGEKGLGTYAYVTSLAGILSLFLDSGITNYFWRKWSHSLVELQKDLSELLVLRIILSFVIGTVFAILIFFEERSLSALLALTFFTTLLEVLRQLVIIFFSSKNEFRSVFYWNTLERFLSMALAIIVLIISQSLLMVFVALFLGKLISTIMAIFSVFGKTQLQKPNLNFRVYQTLLRGSFPLFFIQALTVLYFKTDIILIRYLLGLEEVGIYSSAYRIIEALLVFPNIIFSASFSIFSSSSETRQQTAVELLRITMRFSLYIGAFLGFFLFFYAKEILMFFYGDIFIAAESSLKYLSVAIVILFVQTPLHTYMYANKKDRIIALRLSLLLVFNLFVNILLIPKIGILGAALTTSFTEVLSIILMLRYTKFDITQVVSLRYVLLLFLFTGYFSLLHLRLIPMSIITLALYAFCLLITKEVSLNEIRRPLADLFTQAGQKKKPKLPL